MDGMGILSPAPSLRIKLSPFSFSILVPVSPDASGDFSELAVPAAGASLLFPVCLRAPLVRLGMGLGVGSLCVRGRPPLLLTFALKNVGVTSADKQRKRRRDLSKIYH